MGFLYNSEGVRTKALLIYEGEQTSSSGKKRNYTRDTLEAVVESTNAWHARGGKTKLYKDHRYTQDNIIGQVSNFRLEPITTLTLPHPGMSDLLDKLGIFADVLIGAADAVDAYRAGTLQDLSIGIDWANAQGFGENVIFEVSAVALPAVPGAQLYEKRRGRKPKPKPETYDQDDAPNWRAAMMGEPNCSMCVHYADERCTAFDFETGPTNVCDAFEMQAQDGEEVTDAAPDEVETMTASTVAAKPQKDKLGLSKRFRGIRMANQLEASLRKWAETEGFDLPDEAISTFAQSVTAPPPDPRVAELQAQVEKLARQNETLQRYSKHQIQAKDLVEQGKMQPVVYKHLFGESGIETYSSNTTKDAMELALELFAMQSPLTLGKALPESDAPASDDDDEQWLAEYRKSRPAPRRVA